MPFELLRPPKLVAGDLVRLVSPASFPDQAGIDHCVSTLESWGLRSDTGQHVLDNRGYMAGSDVNRLFDLNAAFKDPDVRAIVTTRGGAGAYRIADDIDFDAVRADPKPLLGFSDITSLHLSLLTHCQLGGIHGCLVGGTAQSSAKQLLMSAEPVSVHRDSQAVSAAVQFPGNASGRLIGGNLQMLATSVGVRLPSLAGAILFLEYHRATLGTIDRYLTQLMRSGALDGIRGVALGSFEAARGKVDRGWSVIDVLEDRLSSLNVPVLGGLRAGHDLTDANDKPDQCCVPLGALAALDVSAGTLTVESVVR
jgi:muramoyltetrapeptide carboxypeptidase